MNKHEENMQKVQRDGMNLQYIPENERTDAICEEAIRQSHGMALEFVPKQTQKLCDLAITYSSHLSPLRFVKPEFKTDDLCKKAVERNPYAIADVKEQTEELCILAVSGDGHALKHIKNPSIKVCEAAIDNNPHALQHIKKQTLELCLRAVRANGFALQYVKIAPNDEICLEALKENPKAERHITDASEEFWLKAARQDWHFLDKLIDQPFDVCLDALKQSHEAYNLIDNPTGDLLNAALSYNGHVLKYIDNPSEEQIMTAIRQNGQALQYVPKHKQTPEMQIEAVKNFGPIISEIDNPTEELQIIAVTQDGTNLQFIKEDALSVKACLTAVLSSKEAREYIPESFEETINWWEENVDGFNYLKANDRADVVKDLEYIKKITPEPEYKAFCEKAKCDPNNLVRTSMLRQMYIEEVRERTGFNKELETFAKAYSDEYKTLYNMPNGGYEATGFNTAIDACTKFWQKNEVFVKAFCGYLGDVPTSDRECATFTFAVIKNPELVLKVKPEFDRGVFSDMAKAFLHSPDPEVRKMATSYGLAHYLMSDPDITVRRSAEDHMKPKPLTPSNPKKNKGMDI